MIATLTQKTPQQAQCLAHCLLWGFGNLYEKWLPSVECDSIKEDDHISTGQPYFSYKLYHCKEWIKPLRRLLP